jgi:hypothetical protein
VQYKVKQFKTSTYFYHALKCNFLVVAVMVAEVEVVVIIVFAAVVSFRSAAIPLIFLQVHFLPTPCRNNSNAPRQ